MAFFDKDLASLPKKLFKLQSIIDDKKENKI